MEFVVRRQLAQQGAALAGLYADNPKQVTNHPTTERLLEVFQEITLTLVVEPHQTRRHVTALSPSTPGTNNDAANGQSLGRPARPRDGLSQIGDFYEVFNFSQDPNYYPSLPSL